MNIHLNPEKVNERKLAEVAARARELGLLR
jgi:hypothetical protein